MKSALLLTVVIAAQSIAFANSDSRVESRSRKVAEQLMAVSECSEASGDAYATTELAGPNNRGDFYSVPATRIAAESSLTIKKCVQFEDYNVNVTGSSWNSKDSAIVGSERKRYQVVEEKIAFKDAQTIRDQKNTTFGGDNTVSVAINILEGLKSRMARECSQKKAQLSQNANPNVACSNQ